MKILFSFLTIVSAALLGGCGSSPSSESASSSDQIELLRLKIQPWSVRQKEIQKCMKEQGFSYIALKEQAQPKDILKLGYRDLKGLKSNYYGLNSGKTGLVTVGKDPNFDPTRSATEQIAFDRALIGPEGKGGGCDEIGARKSVDSEARQQVLLFDRRMRKSPAVGGLVAKWSACMKRGGVEVASLTELQENYLLPMIQRSLVSGSISPGLNPDDQQFEKSLALTDAKCWAPINLKIAEVENSESAAILGR
jgi:hypothetical protein